MKTLIYAIRFLSRSKAYTIINLLGLAFSLACCIILMRYIHRELTVDTHCVDREQVYATVVTMEGNRGLSGISDIQYDKVQIDPRQIDKSTSFHPLEKDFVIKEGQRFFTRTIVTDSVYFQLFQYPLVQGSIALDKPESVLLKESFAQKMFGTENPIGKTIRHSNGKDLVVEGIIRDPVCKTSFQFDMVISLALSNQWERNRVEIYRFMPGTDMEELNRYGSIPRYFNDPQWDTRQMTFSFVPMKDIYWDASTSAGEDTMFLYGSKHQIGILSGVCLLMLLTGILNFVNLYLVAMLRRGKEYGLKKVYGANGRTLFAQIWLENTLLVLSALFFAWLFIEVTQIPINRVLETDFVYTPFDGWLSLGILVLLPLVTSVYPFLKYNYGSPVRSIQSIGWGSRSVRSRMFFLGIQYALTFLLVVSALYFNRQLDMLLHTEPGFRTKNILVAKLIYESQDFNGFTKERVLAERARTQLLNEKLLACPFIEYHQSGYESIIDKTYGTNYVNAKGETAYLNIMYVSPQFFQMFDIDIEEGAIPEKSGRNIYVLNRAAMKAMNFSSLEEAAVVEDNRKRKNANAPMEPIVAVVKDYYNGHLSSGAAPIIYNVSGSGGPRHQIAFPEGKKQDLLNYLKKTMKEVYGAEEFTYSFLEDDVKALYKEDQKIASIYNIFAFIAIAVSCLGLFGISLFDIRQRYREIAIRKAHGAGMKDLYQLLFKKYLLVLGASFVVAVPLAYYLIHQYTADFVVKAPIGIGIFVIALLLVALISMGTLWWQIRKAANIDPATVMKSE